MNITILGKGKTDGLPASVGRAMTLQEFAELVGGASVADLELTEVEIVGENGRGLSLEPRP